MMLSEVSGSRLNWKMVVKTVAAIMGLLEKFVVQN